MIEFYPVFTVAPDFSTPPVCGFIDGRRDFPLGAAKKYGIWDKRGIRTLQGEWRVNNIVDVRAIRDFLNNNQGRSNPFYIPSWAQDFRVTTAAGAGESVIIATVGVDYAVDLQPEILDKFGTIAWFYNRDRSLHVTRIINATASAGNTVEMTMETPLPFAIDAQIFCGFCIFARQIADEVQVKYSSPDVCQMQLGVEEAKHTLPLNAEKEVAGQEINSFPAVVQTRQVPIPAGTELTFYNATVKGPEVYDFVQNFPHQKDWEIELIPDVGVQLTGDGDTPFLSDLYATAPEGAHIHGTFDLGGREHLSVGLTNGNIEIKYKDAVDVIQTQTFEGFSPVMINTWAVDASVSAGQADLCCVYLKKGEAKLWIRFAGGGYATEQLLCNSPVNPLYLINITASQGELLITGLDVTHNLCTWVAQVDPVIPLWIERVTLPATISSGLHQNALVVTPPLLEQPESINTLTSLGISSGNLFNTLKYGYAEPEESVATLGVGFAGGSIILGELQPVLIYGGQADDTKNIATSNLAAGEHFFAMPPTPDFADVAKNNTTATISSGEYTN